MKRLGDAATIFRILLGYIQSVTIVLRFSNVQWPNNVKSFFESLEFLTFDIFTTLPIACVSGSQLGFDTELLVTVILPILSVALVVICGLIVMPLAGHPSLVQERGAHV